MAYLQQFGLGSSQQVSLFSELRGMGGSFCGVGVLALLSMLFQKWEEPALVAATLVFVSFTLFRTAGILIDGLPSQGILFALGIESVFGVLGLALLIRAGMR